VNGGSRNSRISGRLLAEMHDREKGSQKERGRASKIKAAGSVLFYIIK